MTSASMSTTGAVPKFRTPAPYQPLPPTTNGKSAIVFVNQAAAAGLKYRWTLPAKRPITIRYSMGSGCAFLDFNGDGNLDILLIGDKVALYQGDGKGNFRDVTHQTGLDILKGQFLGCAVGDYDNDGFVDLYLSGYRSAALLHNVKGQRFTEVTSAMGLGPQQWGTSCAFADMDGDGYLDLFVGNYVDFGPETKPQLCLLGNAMTSCSPGNYKPLHGLFYQNQAGHRFQDMTKVWNAQTSGSDLGVACADFDGSGKVGIAIANDEQPGDLFQHSPKSAIVHFENINVSSGTSLDRFGHRHAGMGIDWGDYDNDGRPDLFVTTFGHEDKSLYHNLGEGIFEDRSVETGVASCLEPYVSFGCKFADFDNDSYLDLIVANGHVQDNAPQVKKGEVFRQPIELIHNTGRTPVSFERVSDSAGLAAVGPIVGRGLAIGDYDNDGQMDVLVVDSEGGPVLLHNQMHSAAHWIGVALVGTGKSGRDAYGAAVTIALDKRQITRLCRADGSYLSSSDKRVHFGLGAETKVSSVTIRWPDGHLEKLAGLAAGHYWTCTEGKGCRK